MASYKKKTNQDSKQKTDPYSEEKNGGKKYRFHIRLRSFRLLFVCAYSGKECGLGWQVN